jgi:cobalt-zinc-cadmium efflux system membrane fusion protein
MRAVADNSHHLLKPGMFVTIDFIAQSSGGPVIQVASSAVMEHAGEQFVFVRLGETTYEQRKVEVGESNGNETVILRGVSKSDRIVTSGGFVLKSKMLESLMGDE